MTVLTPTERIAALSLIAFATAAGITAGVIGFIYPMGYYGYWFQNTASTGMQDIEVKPISNQTLTLTPAGTNLVTVSGPVSSLSFGHVPSGTPFGGYMKYTGTPPGGVSAGAGRGIFASALVSIVGAAAALLTLIPMRNILAENIRSSLFLVGGAAFLAVDGGVTLGYMLSPEGNIFGGSTTGIQGITLAYTGSVPTLAPTPSGSIITQTSGTITDIVFGDATNSQYQGAEMSVSAQGIAIAFGASFGITAIALLIFPFYIVWKNDPEAAVASMR